MYIIKFTISYNGVLFSLNLTYFPIYIKSLIKINQLNYEKLDYIK